MSENNNHNDDMELELLSETEAFAVLRGKDAGGEAIYNIELGTVTLHLFVEEWEELVTLIQEATSK